jgi:5-carboxymethyl-2-hydroxymuconate isomerase
VEYSANLEARANVEGLVLAVHKAAIATGLFPLGGVRTRATRRDTYRIADGDPENAFVHVTARIGRGRPLKVRRQVGESIMAAVKEALTDAFARSPLAISLEIQEIDPALSFKHNNLHERLKADARR